MESLPRIWIENQNQRRILLRKAIIHFKALNIFNDHQKNFPSSTGEKFEASHGWFERFKFRSHLHCIALKGESGSSDVASANELKTI